MDDRDPVGWVEQLREGHSEHGFDLAWVNDSDGRGPPPPAEHRSDHEAARGQPQGRKSREHLDAGRVEPGLLLCLTQGRGHDVDIGVIDCATGEGRLPRVARDVGGALDEKQVRPVVAVTEQDEDRRLAASLIRREELRELLGANAERDVDERAQPVGDRGVDVGPRCAGHRGPMVVINAAASTGSVGPSP